MSEMSNVADVVCNSEGRPRKKYYVCSFCVLLIVSIILIAVSFRKVASTELGVEYDVWAKTLDDAAKTGGLHAGPPGYRFIKFPSTQITAEIADTCVSRDGLRVNFDVSYQFLMPALWIVPAVRKYRDFTKWGTVVRAAGNSAIQNSCSAFNITNFQSQRNLIQADMFRELTIKLEGSNVDLAEHDGVYARAVSLQLKDVDLPAEYTAAVSDKQSAKEDIALAKNQRNQELTKANTEFLAAEQEAKKILDGAENDVNITITAALLKANQTLFAFEQETQTIVQAKEKFDLDNKGIISYLANELYAKVPNLKASVLEPVQISHREEL